MNTQDTEQKFDLGMLAADCACSVKWEIEKAGKKLRPEYFGQIAAVIRKCLYASNIDKNRKY